jgi:hypothetical protein
VAATVNVNGRIVDQEHALVSVFDHGFLYGEGVYETWRTYNGQPFLFDRHMGRLRNSAGMLSLPIPLTDEELDARSRETTPPEAYDCGIKVALVPVIRNHPRTVNALIKSNSLLNNADEGIGADEAFLTSSMRALLERFRARAQELTRGLAWPGGPDPPRRLQDSSK